MEIVKIPLSSACGVFTLPLVKYLPLFGFALNTTDAIRKVESGEIKVNGAAISVEYVLSEGDLVTCGENGIIVAKDDV